MNLLITAGATREPIDEIRFVSNVSSGATGAALANALIELGHSVSLLRGQGAAHARGGAARGGEPDARLDEIEFSSAADLQGHLQRVLATGNHDAVIMAAAVSDYRVAQPVVGKLSSAPATLSLELVRNPKLLPRLKSWSPRPLVVIGFKLTAGADEAVRATAVATQFAAGGVDAVVHNDLAEIRAVASDQHPFRLYRTPRGMPENVRGTAALATALASLLAGPAQAAP